MYCRPGVLTGPLFQRAASDHRRKICFNSVAARLVAKGEAWVGLTDSDDVAAEQREGASIVPLPLTEESLLIPNTVAVVRGARHPQAAEKLFVYLQRPDVLEKLVAAMHWKAFRRQPGRMRRSSRTGTGC